MGAAASLEDTIEIERGTISVGSAGTVEVALSTSEAGDVRFELVLPADAASPSAASALLQSVPKFAHVPPGYAGYLPRPAASAVYDAHAHLLTFTQSGEGLDALLEAMEACGVAGAAVTGCPLKKRWSEADDDPPGDVGLGDGDTLYYHSATDGAVRDALAAAAPDAVVRLAPLLCGFDPTDRCAAGAAEERRAREPETWRGLGQIYLRTAELAPRTAAPEATPESKGFLALLAYCRDANQPILFAHDATASNGEDLVPSLDDALARFPTVRALWCGCGVLERGTGRRSSPNRRASAIAAGDGGPERHCERLRRMLDDHPNLFLSVTPDCLAARPALAEGLAALVDRHPTRLVVGTSTMGYFGDRYAADWAALRSFADRVRTPAARDRLLFGNAHALYGGRAA